MHELRASANGVSEGKIVDACIQDVVGRLETYGGGARQHRWFGQASTWGEKVVGLGQVQAYVESVGGKLGDSRFVNGGEEDLWRLIIVGRRMAEAARTAREQIEGFGRMPSQSRQLLTAIEQTTSLYADATEFWRLHPEYNLAHFRTSPSTLVDSKIQLMHWFANGLDRKEVGWERPSQALRDYSTLLESRGLASFLATSPLYDLPRIPRSSLAEGFGRHWFEAKLGGGTYMMSDRSADRAGFDFVVVDEDSLGGQYVYPIQVKSVMHGKSVGLYTVNRARSHLEKRLGMPVAKISRSRFWRSQGLRGFIGRVAVKHSWMYDEVERMVGGQVTLSPATLYPIVMRVPGKLSLMAEMLEKFGR